MRAGESILVFPGGAREVFKRKGERYRLRWANRMGFARLAIEHGYPIVPFAAVGADDCYQIVLDAGELRRLLPAVRLLPRAAELPPLVRGLGPTAIPRPQRFYFHFAPPIETTRLRGRERDAMAVFGVREEVREALEAGLELLLAKRRRDPRRRLLPRLASVRRA
jgi:1-acyl-sn-glycerol-3-phosphate acyltransferase